MMIAAAAGIRVFVTGGIGGVHRGGEVTMDVSADLTELGRTPIAVVCAGAKTVLDIPRTLEYLETQVGRLSFAVALLADTPPVLLLTNFDAPCQGVPVVSYGTDYFPAFYSPSSGCLAPCRADTPDEAAKLIAASMRLGVRNGMVIAVPIPEEHMADGAEVENAIQIALREAEGKGVSGNQVMIPLKDYSKLSSLNRTEKLAGPCKGLHAFQASRRTVSSRHPAPDF